MRRNGPRQEQERQIQINIFGPYGCVGGFGLYDCEDHRSVGALRATQSSAERTMAAAAERSLSERLARSYSTASAQGQEETKQRGHPMGRGAKLKAKWALRTPWALPTLSPPPAAVRRCPEPSLCPRFSSAPAHQLPSSRGNRWVHPQLCFFLFFCPVGRAHNAKKWAGISQHRDPEGRKERSHRSAVPSCRHALLHLAKEGSASSRRCQAPRAAAGPELRNGAGGAQLSSARPEEGWWAWRKCC